MYNYINERISELLGLLNLVSSEDVLNVKTRGEMIGQILKELLPVVLIPFIILSAIAAIALIFGILNYRTNKKILKKLEEMKK